MYKYLILLSLFFLVQISEISAEQAISNDKILEGYLQSAKFQMEVNSNIDSFAFFSHKALRLAKESQNEEIVILSLLNIAKSCVHKAQIDSAIRIFQDLNSLKSNLIAKYKPDINSGLGTCYYRSDRKEDALKCFMEAMNGYLKNGNHDALALIYSKMSDISEINQDYKESQNYKRKAIALIPKMKDDYYKVQVYNILAGVYLFTRHLDNTFLDSSLYYSNLSLDLSSRNHFGSMLNTVYYSISDVYLTKNDFEKSIEFNLKTIPYRKYLNTGEIVLFYTKMADCYYYLKQYNKTLVYLDSVKQTLKFIKGNYYMMYYYKTLYLCQKEMGAFESALLSHERYKSVYDSLFSLEKSKAINELSQKYNKAENEVKISELNRQNETANLNNKVLIWAVIASVFFVIILIVYYKKRMVDNRIVQIETEQRLNRARMNPHFFFNALTSLQNISLNDLKRDLVPDFISKFSRIMRQSLESTFSEMDTVENEIMFLTDYLELQRLRSENRFKFSFQVDDAVEVSVLLIPGMILQPFIENSIEHGFKNLKETGQIDIIFQISDNLLNVIIRDNGTGISESKENKAYPSRAIQIIRDRLFLLNKQYKTNATFVVNTIPSGGVEVKVILPLIYNK